MPCHVHWEHPAVLKQAMVHVHVKDKKFSEELCWLVSYSGGKNELMDAILHEFADNTSLKNKEKHDFAGLAHSK